MLLPHTRNALVIAILAIAGCNKANDALVPVAGRVVVDGKPAVGAAVVFHPVDDSNGTHPLGQVDSNGEFQLTTIRSGDGAAPGEYKVTLTWYVSAPRKKNLEGEESPAQISYPTATRDVKQPG